MGDSSVDVLPQHQYQMARRVMGSRQPAGFARADISVTPRPEKRSPREEKFERARQTSGLFLAPVVAIIFGPLPLNLDGTQPLLATVLLGG